MYKVSSGPRGPVRIISLIDPVFLQELGNLNYKTKLTMYIILDIALSVLNCSP